MTSTTLTRHRGRTLVRLLAGSLAALTVVAWSPAAGATAGTYRHHDPAHDVVSRGSSTTDTPPAPHNRSADITRWTAKHAHRTVTSALHLRDVTHGQWGATWFLLTPGGTRYDLTVEHMNGAHATLLTRGDHHVRCPGLARTIRYAADVITVSVPRSCLHRPRWVRVEPNTAVYDDSGRLLQDNGMRDGAINVTEIKYGPRLRRG